MKTPFTADQFIDVFTDYNISVFPLQLLFYVVAFIAIYSAIKPNGKSNLVISTILSFFWLWMGIVYHLLYFSTINKAAYLFGALFILQGILFFIPGIFRNQLSFKFRSDKYGMTGIVLVLYALAVYPILGYFMGHYYPSAPTFGLPCPTAIFTFGLFLMSDKKFPLAILIIPFAWSIIGFSAAFNFGILEDLGLLFAGLIACTMLVIRNRTFRHNAVAL